MFNQCAIMRNTSPCNLRPSAKAPPPSRPFASSGKPLHGIRRKRDGDRTAVPGSFRRVHGVDSTPRASTPVADCAFSGRERERSRADQPTDRSIVRLRAARCSAPVPPSDRRTRWVAIPLDENFAITQEALTCTNDEASEGWPRTFRTKLVPFSHPRRNVSRTELSCAPTSPADIAACVRSRNFLENGNGQLQADGRAPISCRRWRKRYAHVSVSFESSVATSPIMQLLVRATFLRVSLFFFC